MSAQDPRPIAESDAPYEITRRDGQIIAACVCGSGEMVDDKGLGRAVVAAWRTRHARCTPPAVGRDAEADR